MATIKVLGQVSSVATTEVFLYSGSTSAVVSSLVVCNRSAAATDKFRITISQGGAATANTDYLYYDLYIGQNDTFIATAGITLAANDVVRVYAGTSNLTVSLFGQQN